MWGWFPLTIIPATSRREVIIINPDVNLYIWQPGHWWMCWSFSHIAMCFSPTSSLHPWQPRGSDTFLGHREMGGSCSKSSISRRDFWCLSQEVWPVHGKITCKEWDSTSKGGEQKSMDWFSWENLNRKPMGFTIKCRGFLKIFPPILWKKEVFCLLPFWSSETISVLPVELLKWMVQVIPNCSNTATPLGFTLGSIIDKGRPFFPVAKVVVNRLRHEKLPVSNPKWLIHGHP